jgi:hypothetical protein
MILSTSTHHTDTNWVRELGGWLFLFFFFWNFVLFKKGGEDVWVEKKKKKKNTAEDYKGLFILTDWAVYWRMAAESRRYFIFCCYSFCCVLYVYIFSGF